MASSSFALARSGSSTSALAAIASSSNSLAAIGSSTASSELANSYAAADEAEGSSAAASVRFMSATNPTRAVRQRSMPISRASWRSSVAASSALA